LNLVGWGETKKKGLSPSALAGGRGGGGRRGCFSNPGGMGDVPLKGGGGGEKQKRKKKGHVGTVTHPAPERKKKKKKKGEPAPVSPQKKKKKQKKTTHAETFDPCRGEKGARNPF